MNYEKIVRDIVLPLVNDKNINIIVKKKGTKVDIELSVAKRDLGHVIGKKGLIANSIREVVSIAAKLEKVLVRLNIKAHE